MDDRVQTHEINRSEGGALGIAHDGPVSSSTASMVNPRSIMARTTESML